MVATSYALIGVLKYLKKRPVLVVASSFKNNVEQSVNNTKVVAFKNEEVAVAEQ
jgi:hypothetical protein